MVKLYLAKEKEKYIDISIWSLLKANILSSLLLAVLFYGTIFAVVGLLLLI